MAASALGELKDTRAVGPLIQALDDENALVQDDAAEALGKLNDTRAVGPLNRYKMAQTERYEELLRGY